MIPLDLSGAPRQPATCAHCGSRIVEGERLDRTLLGWVATGIVLPRICGACYEASERARDMEE